MGAKAKKVEITPADATQHARRKLVLAAREYEEAQAALKAAKRAKQDAKERVFEAIVGVAGTRHQKGLVVEYDGGVIEISSWEVNTTGFDEGEFKTDHPELHEKYQAPRSWEQFRVGTDTVPNQIAAK